MTSTTIVVRSRVIFRFPPFHWRNRSFILVEPIVRPTDRPLPIARPTDRVHRNRNKNNKKKLPTEYLRFPTLYFLVTTGPTRTIGFYRLYGLSSPPYARAGVYFLRSSTSARASRVLMRRHRNISSKSREFSKITHFAVKYKLTISHVRVFRFSTRNTVIRLEDTGSEINSFFYLFCIFSRSHSITRVFYFNYFFSSIRIEWAVFGGKTKWNCFTKSLYRIKMTRTTNVATQSM